MILRMIDNKPEQSVTVTDSKPRPPLVFPPNFRDVTAEKIGTTIGIIGATGAQKGTKPGWPTLHSPQGGASGSAPSQHGPIAKRASPSTRGHASAPQRSVMGSF
jgi:hypothetical protein